VPQTNVTVSSVPQVVIHFVELFNPGTTAVSVAGWSVQ
jgi:hypothetical protein